MKRVFYFLNTVPEWIEVVSKLQDDKNWHPIVWITTETLQEKIAITFPETLILDLQSHKRGEFDSLIYEVSENFLDKRIIDEYNSCEKIVIPMMNRMDPTRHNFNYHQRIQLYYRILSYWLYMFEKYKPDLLFFDETPHVPFEYVMYEVALHKGIRTIRFNPTHINHRLLLFGKVNETPNYLKERYEEILNSNEGKLLSHDVEEYYQKLQGTYEEAQPYYMKKESINVMKMFKQFIIIMKRFLMNQSDSSYQRTSEGYLQDFKLMKFIKIYNRISGRIYKYRLLREYRTLAVSKVDFSAKYIYVPLHFQPERTTSPDGDIYENQWLMVQLLSKKIPKDWKIYVKEHISQFRKDFSGEMGRNIEFYRELLLFSNVELVPLTVNSYDLIDNAQVTATISGTVGLESICRNQKVLLFGHPWFEICEGIIKIKYGEDLDNFFKKGMDKSIDQSAVKAFFKLIDEYSLPANHSGNIWNREMNPKKNVQNLLFLIEQYEDKIR